MDHPRDHINELSKLPPTLRQLHNADGTINREMFAILRPMHLTAGPYYDLLRPLQLKEKSN